MLPDPPTRPVTPCSRCGARRVWARDESRNRWVQRCLDCRYRHWINQEERRREDRREGHGHRFGDDLRCVNCDRAWSDQQRRNVRCEVR